MLVKSHAVTLFPARFKTGLMPSGPVREAAREHPSEGWGLIGIARGNARTERQAQGWTRGIGPSTRPSSPSTSPAAAASASAARSAATRWASIRRQRATLALCSSRVGRRRGRRCRRRRSRGSRFGRVERGLDGGAAGVGDGRRRQAVDDVGVVAASPSELRSARRPRPSRPSPRGDAVDDRRVDLEPHAVAQAVDEDGGDQRALLGDAGLLLDDGGEGQRLLGLSKGRSGARPAQASARIGPGAAVIRARIAARSSPGGRRSPAGRACLRAGPRRPRRPARFERVRAWTTCQLVTPSATTIWRMTLPPRLRSTRISSIEARAGIGSRPA